MNILIITSSYPPEIRSSSHLMQALAEELSSRGHNITVGTSYPEVNLSDETAGEGFPEHENKNSIDIVRVKTLLHPHKKAKLLLRGISYLLLPVTFFVKIKRHLGKRIDIVIVYSPPLTLFWVGAMVSQKYKSKFILNVQDIFPQNAVDLGILTNPLLIKFFEFIEKKAYRDADVVTVHSESNRKFLIRSNKCAPEKIVTLNNWIDLDEIECRNKTGMLWNLFPQTSNKFVFFFGGVLGPSQGLELIIDAAKLLSRIREIVIVLIGDGLEKERLVKKAKTSRLKNVIFHQFVSKSDYQRLLSDVNVGLVCLSSKNKTPVVPGKILGYMAAGIPILAFLHKESDGHQIIREAKCGYSENSNNPQKAAELMMKMYREGAALKKLGINGADYAEKYFSKQVCVNKLEALFI